MNKILWVKFGWSEHYSGGPVDGNFEWLNEHGKKRGHEAFNFTPNDDGFYHCYVMPQVGNYAPYNKNDNKGWTVICLSKKPGITGIHIVGWYTDAILHGEWIYRSEDFIKQRGDASHQLHEWTYCISSKNVYFIPPESREPELSFSDISVRQGKYSYLKGPGVKITDNKKRVLSRIEARLDVLALRAIKNPDLSL
ncbi:hypothetical protein [Klebsiella michiganensis]|uniref:hypothetical protein n=1 Tax=Klebsiella michiganensis TaxID=1134687 RepID=UPI003F50676D